jgi:hypothetical protein
MTFGVALPGHAAVFAEAMGELGDGYVCAGSFRPLDDLATPGIKFCSDLQDKYRAGKRITHIMYEAGVLEAMIQVEALRLAMKKYRLISLHPVSCWRKVSTKIKNLDTGEISSTPLTYGKGDIEGVDEIRIDQVQKGKPVKVGSSPVRHIYTKK